MDLTATLTASLDSIRQEQARLTVAENALVAALNGNVDSPAPAPVASPPAAAAAPAATASKPAKSKRGRPAGKQGGNTRAAQALALVTSNPGIAIPAIAEAMGIEPNYLYRVMPKLVSEGKVRNENGGWHPATT